MSDPSSDPNAKNDGDEPPSLPPLADETIEAAPRPAPAEDPLDRTMVSAPDPAASSPPSPPAAAAPKPPSAPRPMGVPPSPPKPPGSSKPAGAPASPPKPPSATAVPAAPAAAPQAAAAPSPPRPAGPPKPPGAPRPPGAPKPPGVPKPPGSPSPPAAGPSAAPAAESASAPAAPAGAPKPPAAPRLPGVPKPPGEPKAPGSPKPPGAPVAGPVPPPSAPSSGPSAPKSPAVPVPPAAPEVPGGAPAPKPPAAAASAKPAAAGASPPPKKQALVVDPEAASLLPKLTGLAVFEGVDPDLFLEKKTPGMTIRRLDVSFRVCSPKAIVCREGEYTADFFVVLEGLVGVYRRDGARTTYFKSLAAGDWFGEMSCMSNAPRSATVEAESESVLIVVPRHAFMRIYEESDAFRARIDEAYRERALANHLSGVSLFRGVKESILKRIGVVAELVVAEKGAAIVKEGDPGDAFFLVRTGHAKVTRGEEILAWLCENSFFGEVALLEDKPRGSTVSAVDRMDLVKIPKVPFLALLDEHADVKETVLARVRRIYETEFLSAEEAAAEERKIEIGTEHEVVKAGAALVIDMSKCTRCNMCVEGCVEAHDDRIPRIGKRGIQYGALLLTSSCYNCKVPDCMLACKFGAIRRDRRGQVNIDPVACVGCAACEPACPYGTIHMQSLVGDASMEVKASPISSFLGKLPFVPGFMKPKAVIPMAEEKPAEPGGKKRMAVKCDLCAGRADMACIYNCPCGAIERIDPTVLLESR